MVSFIQIRLLYISYKLIKFSRFFDTLKMLIAWSIYLRTRHIPLVVLCVSRVQTAIHLLFLLITLYDKNNFFWYWGRSFFFFGQHFLIEVYIEFMPTNFKIEPIGNIIINYLLFLLLQWCIIFSCQAYITIAIWAQSQIFEKNK